MIKIVSLSFDKRTKIIMGISIIIAICIMIYNIFTIVILNSGENFKLNKFEIENIVEFEATYSIEVNSNKNTNTYKVNEYTNFESNNSKLNIENGIVIEKNEKMFNIKDYSNTLEYNFEFDYTDKYNCIFIGDIFRLYSKIINQELDSLVEKIEKDNTVTFRLYIQDKTLNNIDIKLVNDELSEIIVYDNKNEIRYYIKLENFVIKKTN